MEQITLDGITYKVGDMLRVIKHNNYKNRMCILKDIKRGGEDIFFYVLIEGFQGIHGGYYPSRFEKYKTNNISNY